MPSGTHNVTNSDFIVSVRGKQFVLNMDAELVVGVGDHQFMLSLDYAAQTVYLTDPKTGEKMNLEVKDIIVDGTSIKDKLDIIAHIQDIVDISTEGLVILEANTRVGSVEDRLLNRNTLSGNNSYEITGLEEGFVIYRLELVVDTPFYTDPDVQHNISVYGEDDTTLLMDQNWNDPNTVGAYSSSVNYTVGSQGKLVVHHDLINMISGIATLRIYGYKLSQTSAEE